MDHCVSQFQRNYLDVAYQAGTRGLKYAASKGLAVVVMEPLRGSALARYIPPAVQALWDSVGANLVVAQGGDEPRPYKRTPADWALQWLWNQPLAGAQRHERHEHHGASGAEPGQR